MTDLLPTFLAFFGCRGSKNLKIRLGCFPGVLGSSCSFLVSSCSFLFLVLGLGFKRGGVSSYFWGLGGFPGVWGSSCSFLVFSCSFLLVGSGFRVRGGFFLFWGLGVLMGQWFRKHLTFLTFLQFRAPFFYIENLELTLLRFLQLRAFFWKCARNCRNVKNNGF